ncbi:MAG TPA: cupin domain-containing protein [Myxococcales bacterium]|nr:cupin domain-containing protein [Myxococcales bacterium]
MKNARRNVVAAAIAVAVFWVGALVAQQPGFKRVELQRIDTSTPGWEAVLMRADFDPKAQVGKHTHPGNEVAYILEGALELSVEGKPPKTLKKGESFSLPANTVHWAKNVASGPTKVLVTYIVEKGKPIATPVTTAMK